MPGFNISAFNSLIETNGLQKTNKFRVKIPIPIGLQGHPDYQNLQTTGQWLEYYAETSSIPGVIINSHANLRYGYGPFEKKPVGAVFEDLPMAFIGDGLGGIHNFFTEWLKIINNFDMSYGIAPAPAKTPKVSGNTLLPYHLAYKYEYCSDVSIVAQNDIGDETINITLREAWPTMVGSLPLNWNDQNTVAKIPVVWTYQDWYKNPLNDD